MLTAIAIYFLADAVLLAAEWATGDLANAGGDYSKAVDRRHRSQRATLPAHHGIHHAAGGMAVRNRMLA